MLCLKGHECFILVGFIKVVTLFGFGIFARLNLCTFAKRITMKLIPYLNFAGDTEEALNYYQEVFNGAIRDLNRVGEMFPPRQIIKIN